MVMPVMVIAAVVLVLLSVAVIAALVVPLVTLPKEIPVSVAVGDAPIPLPLTRIDCVAFALRLLLVSTTSPESGPETVGVKFTDTLQLEPWSTELSSSQRLEPLLLMGKSSG